MTDLIRRADAIDAVIEYWDGYAKPLDSWDVMNQTRAVLETLPSADAEQVTGKLKKPCDSLLTGDSDECKEQKSKLESAEAVQMWIPCSERLPEAEDMYQPPEQRYLCQLEAYGERKFCVLSRLKGAISPFWDWYGVAVHDSEVTAWMPLPAPYKGGEE